MKVALLKCSLKASAGRASPICDALSCGIHRNDVYHSTDAFSQVFNKAMKIKLILMALMLASIGFADSDTNFPAWTYYGEIVEHFALLAVAILGFIFLMPYSKKEGMHYTLSGLALLALSQLLVNMQHFMIIYAGIYTALVHHGILLVSIAFLIVGFHKSLASGK